jgi:hypothetical protein
MQGGTNNTITCLINDVLTKILHLMGKLVVFDDICKLELPVAVGAYGQINHTKHISGRIKKLVCLKTKVNQSYVSI